MATPDLRLRVNGQDYGGWKSATIIRGIEAISGAFQLTASDRWAGQGRPWPIMEEDVCALLVAGERVILGYVDKREPSFGPSSHSFSVSGRDRAAALVDCSAVLGKWEFLKVDLLTLAQRLASPFGISVALQPGLKPPKPVEKVSINPGDTAFDVLERTCRAAGVLPVSDGEGGIVLTRVGQARASTALVEGQNIISADAEFNAEARYSRYIVMAQHPGAEGFAGEQAAAVRGEARDESVRRTDRVLLVHAEGAATRDHARRRAQWEAKVRAGRAAAVSVTVQGWTQGDGSLWPVNALVPVRAPFLGVDGDLLITQATYSLSESGSTTELELKRPDAFLPEPVVSKGGERWKELGG